MKVRTRSTKNVACRVAGIKMKREKLQRLKIKFQAANQSIEIKKDKQLLANTDRE